MTALILVLAFFCIAATAIHIVSVVIVAFRFRRAGQRTIATVNRPFPPVSLVRPLCGLDFSGYEVLFCVAPSKDPVVPLVEDLIAEHPAVNARLLFGNERVNNNPKLNNMLKGWHAARHDWVVFADSNV